MKKIPTLFKRDPEDMRRVLPEVTPGCEWVLAGEGVATRKYDGTCVLLVDPESLMSVISLWWARREVKPGKALPPNFSAVMRDETTGKTVGWEPIEQSPFAKFHQDALEVGWPPGETDTPFHRLTPGTYELCGPKVNGNPEGFTAHVLVRHSSLPPLPDAPRDFNGLREWLLAHEYEGVVWHHPDGRMAKLKRKDFPR